MPATMPKQKQKAGDEVPKPRQLNVTLSAEEVEALEAFRASLGIRKLSFSAAGYEAITRFLRDGGFLTQSGSDD